MKWHEYTVSATAVILTDVVGKKDDKERRDQVIDPLDVPTGRVSHGPDKQDTLETLLHYRLLEQWDLRVHTRNINRYLTAR